MPFFRSLSLYNRQGCSSHRFYSELLRPVWDLSLNMRRRGGALSPSHSSVFSGKRDWLKTKRLASRQGRNAQVNRSISHLSQSVWALRVRLLTWLLWGRRGDESVWNTSKSAGGNRGTRPTNTPRSGLIIYWRTASEDPRELLELPYQVIKGFPVSLFFFLFIRPHVI